MSSEASDCESREPGGVRIPKLISVSRLRLEHSENECNVEKVSFSLCVQRQITSRHSLVEPG